MIIGFFDDRRFLSNFYIKPVSYEGMIYPHNEAAFMAAKSLDLKIRERFLDLTPMEARKLGRAIDLRPNWEEVKLQVMYDINLDKFGSGIEKEWLLKTGNDELVEYNWWHDCFWGVCLGTSFKNNRFSLNHPVCEKCKGQGQNNLGKTIMKVRSFIQI